MGITKLMHMKEGKKRTYQHLKNGIEYILNESKTQNGIWIGGNCGVQSDEILKTFLDTKTTFGKTDGRQGYHFVISFKQGETDEATCYEIVKDFCALYLGDRFDYVFAIHNDKDHIHGHVIFNSVSRSDGLKYHYTKGDWEKSIQPVTDKVAVKYGLKSLEITKERVGVPYEQWSEGEEKLGKRAIVRADIDLCIERATDWAAFVKNMGDLGYSIHKGASKRFPEGYLSFRHPAFNKAVRSTALGEGYSPTDIQRRIRLRQSFKSYEQVLHSCAQVVPLALRKMVYINHKVQVTKRLYQAVSYYHLPNSFAAPGVQVRKDLQILDDLVRQCSYLLEQKIEDASVLNEKIDKLKQDIHDDLLRRRALYRQRTKVENSVEADRIDEQINLCNLHIKQLRKEYILVSDIVSNESININTLEREENLYDEKRRFHY